MACIPAPEFQALWSNQIESLKLEYRNTIDRHPDASNLMERVDVVLREISSLEECTPASVGESTKCKQIIKNSADTGRILHQILQRETNKVYIALHGVYAEVLIDLKWS
jgi:hypothetical protein